MQYLKERAALSIQLCRFTAVAGCAVAIAAVCVSPSFAQYSNAPATESETTTTVAPNGVVQTTVSTSSTGVDYRILADPDMDHFAIMRAKAYGLTDSQIAQTAKLAHLAWVPMSEVLDKVEDGRTIASLAIDYGVPLDRVMDSSDWQDRINDYLTAYSNTGLGAIRHGTMQPTVQSYSSNSGAMGIGPAITPGGTTIAPSGAAVMPNGTTVAPNGATVEPNGATVAPNGTTVTPNGATVAPNGTIVTPGGTTTAPNGTTVSPGGTTTAPNGTTVPPSGTPSP
jgi:hypothetical protein